MIFCLALMIFVIGVVPCSAEMKVSVDGMNLNVEWENNESVKALKELAPLTVEMTAYGGFEQVGGIGRNLPRNDSHITTKPGDIMLYSGNQIVIFHGANSWSYTRLGKIIGKSRAELSEILSKPGVTLKISAE